MFNQARTCVPSRYSTSDSAPLSKRASTSKNPASGICVNVASVVGDGDDMQGTGNEEPGLWHAVLGSIDEPESAAEH